MKKFSLLAILVLFLGVLTACGGEKTQTATAKDEKYVLKAAIPYSSASLQTKYVEWFNEELKKRSDGRLSLDIYPEAQLMPANQEIPGILAGQIDLTHTSSGVATSFEPSYYLFDLPFLFDFDAKDPSVYAMAKRDYLNSENGGKKITSKMEEKGLKVLAHTTADDHSAVFMADPNSLVTNIDSLKGKKLRVTGGTIVPETLKAVGASGITINGSELSTALQQGVVDGLITTPLYAYDSKLPVKTVTFLPLVQYTNPVVMSQSKFDSLPADLQEILVETGKDLEEYSDQLVIERLQGITDKFKEEGFKVYYPTKDEMNEWRKATLPVWKDFAKTVDGGQELLDALE